jgi:hypothetical protein
VTEQMERPSRTQEIIDSFYFEHGKCCSGCDWWRSITSTAGDCTKSAPVNGAARWAMLGIDLTSARLAPGHVVTARDHVCGDFKDEFDWSSLPLPYRIRIGDPSVRGHRS